MKGEYLESPSDHPGAATPPTLFAKLQNPFSLHHFRPSPPSPEEPSASPKAKHPADPPSGDGSTIEVVRRRRGRPPGSKNKPKPPLVITRDPEPSLSPYILEVPCGSDVVASLHSFCRRRSISLSVLSASGSVSDFTLRQPSSSPAPGATLTFHGRFEILSISATFVAPQAASSTFFVPDGFKISVAGPQGQMLGGSVAGPLVAAGPVFVVAATFSNPSFHRLPSQEDDGGGGGSSSLSGRGGDGHSPPASGGCESAPPPPQPPPADSGASMYSCHLPSDVIWAPAPRQAPPY